MKLFEDYTNDESSCYDGSNIDWKTMFQSLQSYRQKAIEQSKFYRIYHTIL